MYTLKELRERFAIGGAVDNDETVNYLAIYAKAIIEKLKITDKVHQDFIVAMIENAYNCGRCDEYDYVKRTFTIKEFWKK